MDLVAFCARARPDMTHAATFTHSAPGKIPVVTTVQFVRPGGRKQSHYSRKISYLPPPPFHESTPLRTTRVRIVPICREMESGHR